MIRNFTITKAVIGLISLTFILSSCSTWHYNNPRVRVDKQNSTYPNNEIEEPAELAAIPWAEGMEDKKAEHTLAVDSTKNRVNTDISYVENMNDQKLPSEASANYTKSKTPLNLFSDLIKTPHKIFKAQQVEKNALSGWVRIMVILFVVGFILLLIGIFLSVFIYGGFWWLFWTFGALCILAGFIILILGLVGLI